MERSSARVRCLTGRQLRTVAAANAGHSTRLAVVFRQPSQSINGSPVFGNGSVFLGGGALSSSGNRFYAADRNAAKPYAAIPTPPQRRPLGNLGLLTDSRFLWDATAAWREYRDHYGDILRLVLPGLEDIVVVFDPEDVGTLLAHDGHMPDVPFNEAISLQRRTLFRKFFPRETGLTGSQGEEWFRFRFQVQQDLMQPASALFYIDDLGKFL